MDHGKSHYLRYIYTHLWLLYNKDIQWGRVLYRRLVISMLQCACTFCSQILSFSRPACWESQPGRIWKAYQSLDGKQKFILYLSTNEINMRFIRLKSINFFVKNIFHILSFSRPIFNLTWLYLKGLEVIKEEKINRNLAMMSMIGPLYHPHCITPFLLN